jgi:hypothetical protein
MSSKTVYGLLKEAYWDLCTPLSEAGSVNHLANISKNNARLKLKLALKSLEEDSNTYKLVKE